MSVYCCEREQRGRERWGLARKQTSRDDLSQQAPGASATCTTRLDDARRECSSASRPSATTFAYHGLAEPSFSPPQACTPTLTMLERGPRSSLPWASSSGFTSNIRASVAVRWYLGVCAPHRHTLCSKPIVSEISAFPQRVPNTHQMRCTCELALCWESRAVLLQIAYTGCIRNTGTSTVPCTSDPHLKSSGGQYRPCSCLFNLPSHDYPSLAAREPLRPSSQPATTIFLTHILR